MKNHLIKALLTVLMAISFVARAHANPWWWPVKTQVKTEQLALPANNGGIISVTVPSKTTSPRRSTGHWSLPELERRRTHDAVVSLHDQREDERIAADLERHF